MMMEFFKWAAACVLAHLDGDALKVPEAATGKSISCPLDYGSWFGDARARSGLRGGLGPLEREKPPAVSQWAGGAGADQRGLLCTH